MNAGLDCSYVKNVINRVENPTLVIDTTEVHQLHMDWDAYTSLEWGWGAIPATKNKIYSVLGTHTFGLAMHMPVV